MSRTRTTLGCASFCNPASSFTAAPRAAAPAAKTLATHAAPSVVSTTANVSPLAPWPSRSSGTYRPGNPATSGTSTILAGGTYQMLLQLKEKYSNLINVGSF